MGQAINHIKKKAVRIALHVGDRALHFDECAKGQVKEIECPM